MWLTHKAYILFGHIYASLLSCTATSYSAIVYETAMAPLLHVVLAFSYFASLVAAHDNGMDMSMDGGMSLSMGNMIMYLHFTPGDTLWFLGWVASSSGAMVGACIGLFMLGMVDRWLGAMRAVMEMHWHARCASARVRLAPLVLTSSI